MTQFKLTDELIEKIIDILENQDAQHFINGYALPNWDSGDGYKLREDFCSALYPSIIKQSLSSALHNGRGAFRNFKDVLNKYPSTKKLWECYKQKHFRVLIQNWYNNLCISWGLEIFPCDDDKIIDASDILKEDFRFETIKGCEECGILSEYFNDYYDNDLDKTSNDSHVIYLWRAMCKCIKKEVIFVCYTQDGEVAGVLSIGNFSKYCDEGSLYNDYIITEFFVKSESRGLGIATQLVAMCIAFCNEAHKNLIAPFVTDEIAHILELNDFTKVCNCYMLIKG